MASSPVESVLRKLGLLARIADRYYDAASSGLPERIRRAIHPFDPAAVGSPPPWVASEDGGSALEELEAYTVYVVKAWSASYEHAGDSWRPAASHVLADAGIVVPYGGADARVRVYREILEAKTALRAVEPMRGGLLLWDGSIRPLIRGRTGVPSARLWPMLEALAADRLGYGSVESLYLEVARRAENAVLGVQELLLEVLGVDGLVDEDARWISLLEWVEKLHALRLLLQAAWDNGVLPVFITKTSRSSVLVRGSLPDVYYLRRAERRRPFYTDPLVRLGVEELLHGIPEPRVPTWLGLSGFYSNRLAVIEFYARLAPGRPILKIDVAVPQDRLPRDAPGEEARRIQMTVLSWLSSLESGHGYPWPLRRAHSEARVGLSDVEKVIRILRLELERRGRSMLL